MSKRRNWPTCSGRTNRLREKLKQAELIMDVQKKVAQMLGVTLAEHNLGEEA